MNRRLRALMGSSALVGFLLSGCSRPTVEVPRVPYVPISQIEQSYGHLITVSNSPTPDQNGTGDRLGLFRADEGTIWGIPISESGERGVLGCAPPNLRDLPVTDTLPDDAEIVGAANEPTGWRGGAGKLELLLRDAKGNLRWHPVAAGEVKTGPVCVGPVRTSTITSILSIGESNYKVTIELATSRSRRGFTPNES